MQQLETAQTEIANDDERAGTAIDETAPDDDLSPDEERFVAAFVDYWIRRGSQLMGVQA